MSKLETIFEHVNIQQATNAEILEVVKNEVEQQGLSEDLEGTPEHKLTLILYTAAVLRTTDVARLSQITGCDVDFVRGIADNMALSKLWIDGHPRCEEWRDEETGLIGFVLHKLVAQGLVVRTDEFRNGRPVYRAMDGRSWEASQCRETPN